MNRIISVKIYNNKLYFYDIDEHGVLRLTGNKLAACTFPSIVKAITFIINNRDSFDAVGVVPEIENYEDDFSNCMNPPIDPSTEEHTEMHQFDPVNHPSHYESGKFECIEVMEEALGVDAVKSFCLCNAFKYLYRHERKNGDEDIRKAKWYLDHYCSLLDKEVE